MAGEWVFVDDQAAANSCDWRLNSSVSFSPQITASGVFAASSTRFIGESFLAVCSVSLTASLTEVCTIGSKSKMP
ncbi:MAG: hypothetical protein EBZ52_08285, partial [Actinobacteria bacterium]|nr:hypothetical protein [Actinomycetota bacterium]